VRQAGSIHSQAVLVTSGINWEGKRQIPEVTRALCAETHEAWRGDNRCIDMDMLSRPAQRAPRESRVDLGP
jgi:transposase-like protein